MKRKQMYFCPDISEEYCYALNYIVDEMNELDLQQVTVARAVRETETEYFFCKAIDTPLVKDLDEPCGKSCADYEPRNGKNGCCKHRGFCYKPGDEYTLTADGKLTKILNQQ